MSLAAPLAGSNHMDTAVLHNSLDPDQHWPETTRRSRLRFACGLFLLGVVVVLWVFSSILTQFLYDDPNVDYNKPTALTTLCTATASIFALPQILRCCTCWRQPSQPEVVDGESPTIRIIFMIALNWFFCQWTFNVSLAHTALATNTLLSSTSVIWGYLFSVLLGLKRLSLPGIACVVCAMSGVTLAVFGKETRIDPHAPMDDVWGEALALGSAISYGVFSNMLALKVTPSDMNRVWGGVGFFAVVIGSVLMAIGHLTGLEPLEAPSNRALGIMLLNGFLGTSISDYLWAQGVLLTSPVLATVCLNLTIPVSMVSDAVVLRQHAFSWTASAGAGFVFVAVLVATLDDVCSGAPTTARRRATPPPQMGCAADFAGAARGPT